MMVARAAILKIYFEVLHLNVMANIIIMNLGQNVCFDHFLQVL